MGPVPRNHCSKVAWSFGVTTIVGGCILFPLYAHGIVNNKDVIKKASVKIKEVKTLMTHERLDIIIARLNI